MMKEIEFKNYTQIQNLNDPFTYTDNINIKINNYKNLSISNDLFTECSDIEIFHKIDGEIEKLKTLLKSNHSLQTKNVFEELEKNYRPCLILKGKIDDSYQGIKGLAKKISSMFYNWYVLGEFKSSAQFLEDSAKKMMSLELSLSLEAK